MAGSIDTDAAPDRNKEVREIGMNGVVMRPVKVLQVTKALTAGGAENLFKAISLRAMSHGIRSEVAHVLPADPVFAEQLHQGGIETHALGGPRLIWTLKLARLILRGDYDIVHVHSPLPGSLARVVARIAQIRKPSLIVTTEHNSWGAYHPLTRLVNRLTIRLDNTTIAVSAAAVRSMSGPAAKRARPLLHGIDLNQVRSMAVGDLDLPTLLGLSDSRPIFACVAHHRPAKDHPTLLRALRELRLSDRNFHCVLVGQGTDDDVLKRMITDLDLSTHVTALGRRHDIPEIIRQSAGIVLASSIEGFPVVIMEAAAIGTPVVATRVGGIPEHLTDGENALLVEPGQPTQLARALATLIDSPDEAGRLSQALSAVASKFDLDHSLAEYLAIYQSSIGSTRS